MNYAGLSLDIVCRLYYRDLDMKSFLFCVLMGWACAVRVAAQERVLWGNVGDEVTHIPLENTLVTLLDSAGNVVDSIRTFQMTRNSVSLAAFQFRHLQNGSYTLVFQKAGYEEVRKRIDLQFRSREYERQLPMQLLRRRFEEQQLGEAVVQATKLKFYNKGDTLVYNADAFVVNGQSMLASLLQQMPGIELKENGRIYVNGRYVESLTLNGNGLFRGDNSIMLENLPAFMVKSVKVFEESRQMADRYMGREDADRHLVMDVQLKRQYLQGYIGNTEWGYGTEGRYLGRLFLMRYTNASALTLVGGINNLDFQPMNGAEGFEPDNLQVARKTVKMGGFNYAVQDKVNGRWNFNGSLVAQHDDSRDQQTEASTYLVNGATTYGARRDDRHERNVTFNTSHVLFGLTENKRVAFTFQPVVQYSRNRRGLSSALGTFHEDAFSTWGEEVFDSLRSNRLSQDFRSTLLHRMLNADWGEKEEWNLSGTGDITVQIPYTSDKLTLSMEGRYGRRTEGLWKQYYLDYPAGDRSFSQEHWNMPGRDHAYKVGAAYKLVMWGNIRSKKYLEVEPYYNYAQAYHSSRRDLYREMADTVPGGTGWTALPSFTQWAIGNLMTDNSYHAGEHTREHEAGARAFFVWNGKGASSFGVSAHLPLVDSRRALHYHRADGYDDAPLRHRTWFLPRLEVTYKWPGGRHWVQFNYRQRVNPVDLQLLVGSVDSSDPLSIRLGNPSLHDTHIHRAEFNYQWRYAEKQRMWNTSLIYERTDDAVALANRYELATGVSELRPENVDGNFSLQLQNEWAGPLDAARRTQLRVKAGGDYLRSVDLSTVNGLGSAPQRSRVDNIGATVSVRFTYKGNKVSTYADASARQHSLLSRREGFMSQHLTDMNVGAGVTVDLPWRMQLNTSMNYYARLGYADTGSAKGDWVWNAQLSKSLIGDSFYARLTAFDILGQLSSITKTVNAQGVTERWHSTLPRYFMAHLVYVLNIQPKR